MPGTIIVIVEQSGGAPSPAAYEALGFAQVLALRTGNAIMGLAVGLSAETAAQKAAQVTGIDMISVETQSPYNNETMLHVLEQVNKAKSPDYIVAAGTSQGMDYGPALSVRLGGSCISGVRGIEKANGSFGFIREVQAGKIHSVAVGAMKPVMALVQPGVFSGQKWEPTKPGSTEVIDVPPAPRRTRNIEVQARNLGKSALGDADIIVAVGRGVGKPENLEPARELANLFPRSAVAGSRPVCDSGWLEYLSQVGITGQTVAPKLYIAAGISGASQHVSAMSGSGLVVSINNDPQAAIFNVSDVCIVEDMVSFIPLLIDSLKSLATEK